MISPILPKKATNFGRLQFSRTPPRVVDKLESSMSMRRLDVAWCFAWSRSSRALLLATNYNYFRDYDSATGKYVESDPVGLTAGVNTYGYVGANPVAVIDALGLDAIALPGLRLPPNPGIATVACDSWGQPIAQIPPLQPINEKCIGDCLLVHEYRHIDDLIALGIGGSICRGQPKGTVVTLPPTEQAASERKAYAAELACLQKKLQGLSDCDECRRAVTSRISRVKSLGSKQ